MSSDEPSLRARIRSAFQSAAKQILDETSVDETALEKIHTFQNRFHEYSAAITHVSLKDRILELFRLSQSQAEIRRQQLKNAIQDLDTLDDKAWELYLVKTAGADDCLEKTINQLLDQTELDEIAIDKCKRVQQRYQDCCQRTLQNRHPFLQTQLYLREAIVNSAWDRLYEHDARWKYGPPVVIGSSVITTFGLYSRRQSKRLLFASFGGLATGTACLGCIVAFGNVK